MRKEQIPVRTEVLSVARHVLKQRNSARIIEIASARGDVKNLLHEYRQFMSETERLLKRDGIRLSGQAVELLRSEWSDAVIEHQRPALALRA